MDTQTDHVLELGKSFVALLGVLDKMADKLLDLSKRVRELEERQEALANIADKTMTAVEGINQQKGHEHPPTVPHTHGGKPCVGTYCRDARDYSESLADA